MGRIQEFKDRINPAGPIRDILASGTWPLTTDRLPASLKQVLTGDVAQALRRPLWVKSTPIENITAEPASYLVDLVVGRKQNGPVFAALVDTGVVSCGGKIQDTPENAGALMGLWEINGRNSLFSHGSNHIDAETYFNPHFFRSLAEEISSR